MISRIVNLPKNHSFFLFGARQTGKSTLIEENFSGPSVRTYNLLLNHEYQRLAANPTIFREEVIAAAKNCSHIVVDEVQRIPALLDEIHYLIEHERHLRFIMTGSSARKLKRAQANMLGGRALTYQLFPLTYSEIGASFNLNRALAIGTLPRIYLEPDPLITQQYLRSYVESYLREEIELEANLRNLPAFLRFLPIAAEENTRILNFSAVARDTMTTAPTVREYFKILEDTLLGWFLLPFHFSKRKRFVQHPKFYFFDVGVARAATKRVTIENTPGSWEYGRCFESWLIAETMRLCRYLTRDYEFSFLRTEHGAEVDLVIQTPSGTIIGVEIKSSTSPQPADFVPGFEALRSIHPAARCVCVCNAPAARKVGDYEVWPWQDFLHWITTAG